MDLISEYQLYDLSGVLVCVRAAKDDERNEAIVRAVLDLLRRRSGGENDVRTALSGIDGLHRSLYAFVFTKNVYSYLPARLNGERAYPLLEAAFSYLLACIVERNADKTFACADALHNLPAALAKGEGEACMRRDFAEFRARWDREFLVAEEKNFLREIA